MLSAPVVVGFGLVRLDSETNNLFDHLPALGVTRNAPQMLNLVKEVFVNEGVEL